MFVKHSPFPKEMWIDSTFDLDLLSTDLNIKRDHLLRKDYLPTNVDAFRANVIEL